MKKIFGFLVILILSTKCADKLISTKFNSKMPVSNKEDILRKAYKVALKDFARTGTAGHAKNLKNMTVALQKSMKENIKKDMVKKVSAPQHLQCCGFYL